MHWNQHMKSSASETGPSGLLYSSLSFRWFVIFVIFGIIVIFGIFVIFVRPHFLLSFSNLLYLPVSLPWFVFCVIFCYNCYFRYSFFLYPVVTFVIFAIACISGNNSSEEKVWKSFASLGSWSMKKSWLEFFDITLQFGFCSFKIGQPMMAPVSYTHLTLPTKLEV